VSKNNYYNVWLEGKKELTETVVRATSTLEAEKLFKELQEFDPTAIIKTQNLSSLKLQKLTELKLHDIPELKLQKLTELKLHDIPELELHDLN
jgi:hypothetical protein